MVTKNKKIQSMLLGAVEDEKDRSGKFGTYALFAALGYFGAHILWALFLKSWLGAV